MSCEVIILAAGMGKRMHSSLPKVLHQVAGKPMLFHVIETACSLNASKVHIVVGHGGEIVKEYCQKLPQKIQNLLIFHTQEKQLGTAHAVSCVLNDLHQDSKCLVLYGDTPLVNKELLDPLLDLEESSLKLLTVIMQNPFGYGRIIRDDKQNILRIVEEKDANAQEKAIHEINSGIIATTSAILKQYLPKINNQNAQQEYYLTDLTELVVKAGLKLSAQITYDEKRTAGVNNKVQLSEIENTYRTLQAQKLMEEGVTLIDPKRFDLRGKLTHGQDCTIDINVILEGEVELGNNVTIGAGCIIKNCKIGDNSIISPYTIMEDSTLKVHNTIGPFARLRPGNVLEDEVHIGNFVEVKKSHIGLGTKAGHLSYLGDSDIGRDVNIGAGTITCNYDGANKHKTIIGDDVFVGSDTQLVAPVEVKEGATIGAGSTVTREIPAHALMVSRARPRILEGYERPRKEKK